MTTETGGEPIPYSVTFEGKIDPNQLPQLLAVLGKVSTEQRVSYQIGEPTEITTDPIMPDDEDDGRQALREWLINGPRPETETEAEPEPGTRPETQPEAMLGPELVDWIIYPATDELVAVIAREHLGNFANRRYNSPTRGIVAYNAILRSNALYPSSGLQEYVVVAGNPGPRWLRADRLGELSEKLRNKELKINGVGEKLTDLLVDYSQALATALKAEEPA